jgi:hypothetical protein
METREHIWILLVTVCRKRGRGLGVAEEQCKSLRGVDSVLACLKPKSMLAALNKGAIEKITASPQQLLPLLE